MCFDTGKRYTFQQIYHKSWSLAAVLRQKFQLQVGDTVAVILPNVPDFPVAFLGAIQAGLVVTTVNPFYTPDEMAVQLGDSGSQLIFTNRELLPFVNKATNKLRKRVPTVLAETKPVNCNKQQLLSSHNFYCQADSLPADCVRLDELCDTSNNNNKDKLDDLLMSPDDVALLPYSSGTTGLSKGVQLTHRNVVSNLYQMSSPDFVVNRKTEGGFQDVIPVFLPLFHIYGMVGIFLNFFAQGCNLIMVSNFVGSQFVKLLQSYHPTLLFAVPPISKQ
jgi:4-coumarate--CoA ligase